MGGAVLLDVSDITESGQYVPINTDATQHVKLPTVLRFLKEKHFLEGTCLDLSPIRNSCAYRTLLTLKGCRKTSKFLVYYVARL